MTQPDIMKVSFMFVLPNDIDTIFIEADIA